MIATYTERLQFIQTNFGKGLISRDGNDVTVSCPFCKDSSKKKLAISLETWKYHCWVCSARGNTLVSALKKFKSREVVDYYRVHFLNASLLIADIEEAEDKIELPEGYTPLATIGKANHPDVRAAIRYLERRGITEREIWKFRIGITTEGKFTRRVIFPSLDHAGDLNYFLGRSIDPKSKFRYMNASTDKSGIIFNDVEIDWDKPLYLVEGIFDHIALAENGTCLLGSTLTTNSLLFRKIVANETDVVLCLDSDMTQKIGKISDLLTSYGCNVKIMDTSSAKDIAEMTPEQLDYAKATIEDWNMRSSFRYKISNIKSGSLL